MVNQSLISRAVFPCLLFMFEWCVEVKEGGDDRRPG